MQVIQFIFFLDLNNETKSLYYMCYMFSNGRLGGGTERKDKHGGARLWAAGAMQTADSARQHPGKS